MAKTRINRAAQLLGRKGGRANTPKQLAARRRNAKKGGRQATYRFLDNAAHDSVTLEHLVADEWRPVTHLKPKHLIYLARWLREHKPKAAVAAMDIVAIYYTTKLKEE